MNINKQVSGRDNQNINEYSQWGICSPNLDKNLKWSRTPDFKD